MEWGKGGAEGEGEREKRMVVMIEQQAKEELEIMEAQHPNRFQYLKLELRSFISLLQNNESPKTTTPLHSEYFLFPIPNIRSAPVPDISSLLTQESSTRKKRKKGGSLKRQPAKEKLLLQRRADDGCCGNHRKRREGVDAAIEKARACLHKIQQFKTSFELSVGKNR